VELARFSRDLPPTHVGLAGVTHDAGNFFTDTVHMVERWTMIDPDAIHYQVTIEDPRVYTRPWTMSWALVREKEPGFELLEEACWEGERDMEWFLNLGLKHYYGESWRGR
jgi:hypothetical protein